MVEILRVASSVTTPLALVGAVAALALIAYWRQLKSREMLITSAPQEERARLIEQYFPEYRLEGTNLTREQKFDFLKRRLSKQQNLIIIMFAIACSTFVVCFTLSTIAYIVKIFVDAQRPPNAEGAFGNGENNRPPVVKKENERTAIDVILDRLEVSWQDKVSNSHMDQRKNFVGKVVELRQCLKSCHEAYRRYAAASRGKAEIDDTQEVAKWEWREAIAELNMSIAALNATGALEIFGPEASREVAKYAVHEWSMAKTFELLDLTQEELKLPSGIEGHSETSRTDFETTLKRYDEFIRKTLKPEEILGISG